MQLEAGNTYKSRSGEKITLIGRIPEPGVDRPWVGHRQTDNALLRFYDDGRVSEEQQSSDDLITSFVGGQMYLCIYDYGNGQRLGHDLLTAGSEEAKKKGFKPGERNGQYHVATVAVTWEKGHYAV